jgi:hypothetical protein
MDSFSRSAGEVKLEHACFHTRQPDYSEKGKKHHSYRMKKVECDIKYLSMTRMDDPSRNIL